MTKMSIIAFMMAAVMMSLSGCGHKGPPYYEKPAGAEGSSVAL